MSFQVFYYIPLTFLAKYLEIKENPNGDFTPHTYIFGAKAASGYFMAKKIIEFICALADLINNDPDVKDRLKVVYMGDYNTESKYLRKTK